MEDWQRRVEEDAIKRIEPILNEQRDLLNNITSITDKEELLTTYWKLRKSFENLKHDYQGLWKFVSLDYEENVIQFSYQEIYYYEKLLQSWRNEFPENTIRYDYYLELAELEYDFFIKSKYTMPQEIREEIYQYEYKENELHKQNIFIIINNLKIAQKILELRVIANHLVNDYDALFLIYDVLGNVIISIYLILDLFEEKISSRLYNLIHQAYLYYIFSLENKQMNEDPTVFREGIVGIPYIDLFHDFFGNSNIYSVESKIDFLNLKYHDILKRKRLLEISEELKLKALELQKVKKEIEVYYKKREDLKFEIIKDGEQHYKIIVKKEINELCKEITNIVPKYRNKQITYFDITNFINRFGEDDVKLALLQQLKRITYMTQEQVQDNLLRVLTQVAPKSADKVILCTFKKSIPESHNAWTYFIKFYTDGGYEVINAGNLKNDLDNRDLNEILYYIFIDDVIGSGSQFVDNFKRQIGISLEKFKEIVKNHKNLHFKIVAAIGSWESKSSISKKLGVLSETDILYYTNINEVDKAFHSNHWKEDILTKTIEFLSKKDPEYWRGYNDCEFLVVLEWNVPNNTIGCLWNDPNGWEPLFPRYS